MSEDIFYVVACRKIDKWRDVFGYRTDNHRETKSENIMYVKRRMLPPNFLLCQQCYWTASQVFYVGIEIWSKCPTCGYSEVISEPIWRPSIASLDTNNAI